MPEATALSMFGTTVQGTTTEFRVWAPNAKQVGLLMVGKKSVVPMQRAAVGTFELTASARAGDRYFYVVDENKPVPDPVSRFLPEGVHGPTEIVDPADFRWTDRNWRGLPLEQYIVYELHVGAFTHRGTFEAIIDRLEYLSDLGVTVIELMPVAAFPGERNWGYDGVSPYAVQASYGGPRGLKRLVDAAHACGLAVMLDVVYNHVGNEGNYLRVFGPYFTDKHKTPWGDGINYDQAGCEGVRRYVIENALYWIREYHLDGLRLDAVQTIHDDSRRHILADIKQNVDELARELGRTVCVIAETDENDARITRPQGDGGYGIDAVWSDDFHHTVHSFLTGERKGYYQDFGRPEQIAKALNEGFVFQGEHFNFWGRNRGTSAREMRAPQHVICIQNHDQVGNRAKGERLTGLVPSGARMVAAALLLLAPETPLLFMGEEYDEPAPFQFFTSYSDPALKKAVSEGRRREFKDFDWNEVPDPEDPATFKRSRLNWDLALRGHNHTLQWYTDLIALRKRLVTPGPRTCKAQWHADGVLTMQVAAQDPRLAVVALLKPNRSRDRRRELLREHAPHHGWREALCREEDGYEVRIYQRTT